ncbi:MAG: hypothetical protein KC800_21120 [Candidatus Eremiobacteraeota bacterium]|nr:hypothetical protein [Candidatus Eremiobacteraeota bacterium]
MLDNLVRKMLKNGATAQEVVEQAIMLSRDAYQRLLRLETQLDLSFGGSEFRRSSIEPLLAKSRQVEAIRARVERGGSVRTSDTGNLRALLGRRIAEYESLNESFPWSTLATGQKNLVQNYITERRAHLELGDAERVKSAYQDVLCETAIAC